MNRNGVDSSASAPFSYPLIRQSIIVTQRLRMLPAGLLYVIDILLNDLNDR